jgi:serine/threonine protein kinase
MSTIGGYQLGPLLGHGAFGETYEATKDGQRVALKLIKEEAMQQGFDLRRFQRECGRSRKPSALTSSVSLMPAWGS